MTCFNGMNLLSFASEASGFGRARHAATAATIAFLIIYVFALGIVLRAPTPLPSTIRTPQVVIITQGQIGQAPLIVVYLDRWWIFSMSLEAMLSALSLATLIWLNTAFIVYANNRLGCRLGARRAIPILSSIPSLFAVFSCCGGGLLSYALLAVGLGGLFAGGMVVYGRWLTLLAATALSLNLLSIYRSAVEARRRSSGCAC